MIKKALTLLALILLVALLAVGWRYYGGTAVPPGQSPLVSLTLGNFAQLRAAFNAASGDVRIVLLLSPT